MTLSGSRFFARVWAILRYGLPTSLSRCICMSRGLATELLVTSGVPVTPDLCSAQDLVLSRHDRFSVMHIYVAL